MKVYVITTGVYSDYHIVGVTLNRKKAEDLVETMSRGYDIPHISEWETDEVDTLKKGTCYQVTLYENGKVDIWEKSSFEIDEINKVLKFGNYSHEVLVIAETKRKAKKIGLDLINIKKAKEQGL